VPRAPPGGNAGKVTHGHARGENTESKKPYNRKIAAVEGVIALSHDCHRTDDKPQSVGEFCAETAQLSAAMLTARIGGRSIDASSRGEDLRNERRGRGR
jgi:hypothetical protein